MFLVVRTVHEREASWSVYNQGFPIFRIGIELGKIALPEFVPFLWVMIEPLSQFRAGRDIFHPSIQVQCLFLDAARPEALDENALAIRFGCRFICSFEKNLRHEYSIGQEQKKANQRSLYWRSPIAIPGCVSVDNSTLVTLTDSIRRSVEVSTSNLSP